MWNPLAGLSRRLLGRIAKELVVRTYDAGRAGRGTYGWVAGNTSASAEVYGGLQAMRNRARELVRNDPHARKAIKVLTNNTIGTGIVAQARTGDKTVDRRADDLWKSFVDTCDFEGQRDFYGLQSLAVRSFYESGEALILDQVRPRSGGLTVPLQLKVLEGDYLDHRRNENLTDGRIWQGVEFDIEGKRRRYWLFKEHPGDQFFMIPHTYETVPIAADRVIHLYEKDRPGQIRGVPNLHAVMLAIRELGDYNEAERVRKRLEACMAAFVINADDEAEGALTASAQPENKDAHHVRDGQGNLMEEFSPGMIGYLRGGKDVKFTSPAANGSYPEYVRTELLRIAAGSDVTFELLTGDLSRVNYSSIKAGINEFRRSVETTQWLTIIPVFCNPIWRKFIDINIATGRLPRNTPYDVEWTTPRFEAVDPLKETEADIAAERALLMSPQEAIKRRGYDPEQLLADTKAWHDKLVSLGLSSDGDAALTGKAGAPKVVAAAGGDAQGGGSGDSAAA